MNSFLLIDSNQSQTMSAFSNSKFKIKVRPYFNLSLFIKGLYCMPYWNLIFYDSR